MIVRMIVAFSLIVVFGGVRLALADNLKEADEAARAGQFDKAADIYKGLADSGDAQAQFNLGVLTENGNGVTQNTEESVRLYRSAAEQGLPVAQYAFGAALWFGRGVARNREEAVVWYKRAAEQDFATAQYNLAFAYALGDGTPVDMVQAHVWFTLAARHGLQAAGVNRGRVAQRMTAEEVAQAEKLAAEWRPKGDLKK